MIKYPWRFEKVGGRTRKHIKLNILESSGAESERGGENCHLISPVSTACRCRLESRSSEGNRDSFVKMLFPPHTSPLFLRGSHQHFFHFIIRLMFCRLFFFFFILFLIKSFEIFIQMLHQKKKDDPKQQVQLSCFNPT